MASQTDAQVALAGATRPPGLDAGVSAPVPGDGSPPSTVPELVIEPRHGWIGVDWAEMWHYRELLLFLIWRDLKVRYKQTALGAAWAVLPSVFNMLVFSVIFGYLAKMPSDGAPYPVFVFAGLLPWTFFATGVTLAAQSVLAKQQMLTKVYFPRLFIPAASLGGGFVDFGISFVVYAIILAWYRTAPGWQVVFVPALVLQTTLAALGASFLLSALVVAYRDLRHVVPFLIQGLMYISPVIFPLDMIPRRFRWIVALNPMTGVIDGFRSAILGKPWDFQVMGISVATTVALLVFGLFYFRRVERRFADIA